MTGSEYLERDVPSNSKLGVELRVGRGAGCALDQQADAQRSAPVSSSTPWYTLPGNPLQGTHAPSRRFEISVGFRRRRGRQPTDISTCHVQPSIHRCMSVWVFRPTNDASSSTWGSCGSGTSKSPGTTSLVRDLIRQAIPTWNAARGTPILYHSDGANMLHCGITQW